MKCKFCEEETDYLTVGDKTICLECAKQEKYLVCVHCGELYLEKFLTNDEGLCPSCINLSRLNWGKEFVGAILVVSAIKKVKSAYMQI